MHHHFAATLRQWVVAAGARAVGGYGDFAMAQYDPNGVPPVPGLLQPWAQAFID
jgi:hypothetical protein